ncbi:uncharacterized protein PSFLO_07715 [Pseudozyma flocculosa]|uniref:Uncharacterized protein n=1 Tax=Pseudozyma flocculosa TaxID=84751 RepID=A0A5C3FCU4_9BASI|nr:uncharacterized protein PSFLO_07715 [Pseudozyma flocculosa]
MSKEMKTFIKYFLAVYKGSSELELAQYHHKLLCRSERSENDNARLIAIECLMWKGNTVVVDQLACVPTAKAAKTCKRPTIAGCLDYVWDKGSVVWTKAVIVDCMWCHKHRKHCHYIVVDKDRSPSTCMINLHGFADPAFAYEVDKTGLSEDPEPDFDDPAHLEPIFGWSLQEVREYVRRLRERMEVDIHTRMTMS